MGRLILCFGEKAEKPWYIKETDTKLYSIEELCYYIYNNVYIISQAFFTLELANWIEKELGLWETAGKLKGLILGRNSCKDMVVTVLCSTDYYLEEEIKELLQVMDALSHMSEGQRKKYKADLWLRKGRPAMAFMEYRKLLESQSDGLTPEETGDVLHNLGIACLYTGGLPEAAQYFLEAYGRNEKEESLKAYVEVCQMAHIEVGQVSLEEKKKLLADLERSKKEYLQTEDYQKFWKAVEKKHKGQPGIYYEEIDRLLNEWKQEYRRKVG